MSKNPFEIRTEMLQMAKDYLDQQWHMNMDFYRIILEENIKQGKCTFDQWEKFMPKQYTLEELTKKAQELYSFVEKK